jgi:flagellar biosynthetic protein FliO
MDSTAILPSFFKMLFALATVIGLLVGAAYFFKRFFPQTSVGVGDNSLINIIATRYLGQKSSIMLVEVLGKVVVIGISSNQMSHLATISDVEALDRLKHLGMREKCSPPSLMDYLRRNKFVIGVLHRFGKYGLKK